MRRDERRFSDDGTRSTATAILAGFNELIEEKGYASITVDDIRLRAGVSRATFYFYFRDKKHVFLTVLSGTAGHILQAAQARYQGRDYYARLVVANYGYFQEWMQYPHIYSEFFAMALTDPDFMRAIEVARNGWRERIASNFARHFPEMAEPDRYLKATILIGTVEGFCQTFFGTNSASRVRWDGSCVSLREALRAVSDHWYQAVWGRRYEGSYDFGEIHVASEAQDACPGCAQGEGFRPVAATLAMRRAEVPAY